MSHLLVEQRDGVAIITLNRPEKRNALSPEMVVRLADFWREVATDDSVRVVVVTGAGTQAFSAGGDLGTLIPLMMRAKEPVGEWETRFAADPELRAVAVQLLVAGYTVRDTCKRLRIRPSIMWGWAEDAQVKAAIEKGKELRKRSLGQSLEDAAEAALETLIDVMGDEATTPKDRLKAAELILDRCGLVEIAKGTAPAQETAVRIDVDFDERLARIVAGTRTA
jgi:hypothetical protein